MKSELSNSTKKSLFLAMAAAALSLGATHALAVEDIVESARVACQTDIGSFCKDVTRGEGRILQCLAAHHDKISGRCTYALDDATLQLQRVELAIKYVAMECKSDLEKHCGDIPVGDGRIAQCLMKNNATLAPDCKQAVTDTRMQVK